MEKKNIKKNIVILMMSFLNIAAASAQNDKNIHIIKRGETIESVANKYGVSVEDLIKVNPSAKNYFYVGMKLVIPNSIDKADEEIVTAKTEISTYTPSVSYEKSIEDENKNLVNMHYYSNYGFRYNAPFESVGSGYYALAGNIFYCSGWGLVLGFGSNIGIVDIDFASVSYILGPMYAYKYNNILLSSAFEFVGNYRELTDIEKEAGAKKFTWGLGLCPKVGIVINKVIPSLGVDFMVYPGNNSKITPCFNLGVSFII